tara:strand:- start:2591 stop:4732 length:2142 start_codon:yes stop_codon:yes gene_type:complete
MPPKRIRLLGDFHEDHRISMDVYSHFLYEGINKHFSEDYIAKEYTPKIPSFYKLFSKIPIVKMRLLRYLSYPYQIRKFNEDIFHIIEHGYAHLTNKKNVTKNSIVTVHDLIPTMKWRGQIKGMEPGSRPRLSMYSLNQLENARRIIAISENTKRDLVNLLGLNPNKIKVIYYGIGEQFKFKKEEKRAELRRKLGLPDEKTKLILITGQELYKNHRTCLKVMKIIEAKYPKEIRMVRLGSDYPEWDKFHKETKLVNKVIQINKLNLEEVADLYNCTDVLLFPSFYEGFGRPPLEAMACGLPVVCSNAASLPEVVGNAALVADPEDEKTLSNHVLSIITDDNLKESQIDKGLKNIERFSWRKNIEETINLYNEIINEKKTKIQKVVFFHRKMPFYGSIELYFSGVRNYLSAKYNLKVFQSTYTSQGFFKRIYNILEAFIQQSDINHITGDVHFLSYLMKKNKTILSIMDCGSVINSTGIKRAIYKFFWFTLPLTRVRAVTVISEKTKNELISITNYPKENIHVIPVCIQSEFIDKKSTFLPKKENSFNQDKPKIMHIGTTKNKNLSRVCLALKDIDCNLEIVGQLDNDHIDKLEKNNINYTNSFALEQNEIIEKYYETDILIFVSTYEGFGVPILEAQAMGIPVITSNISPMIEVSGGAAILVDPYNIDEIRNAINKVKNDTEFRQKIIKAGLENARNYHPKKISAMFEEVYRQV